MKLLRKTLVSAVIAISLSANAQQIKVATGGQKGTYATMFKELNSVCSSDVAMLETNTNGSNTNIDLLVGNQVNAAFTQTDVLYFRARTEDLENVKTLIAFHPEEVHIVALAVGLKTEGGTMGFGGQKPVLTQIGDLNRRAVGAVGGSYTTAQVIRLQSEVNFTVRQYDDNAKLLAALNSGEVDAALMVGGSPLQAVSELTPAYRLVAIPEAFQQKLKAVYRPARLNYTRMGAAGVPTVSTDAIFVTREYKTPKMQDALRRFRTCALSKLNELKETTGTHPKWQAVSPDNKGKWPWYQLDTKGTK